MQGIDPDLALRIVRDDPNPIAFDTETTGLTRKDIVCGWVITNAEHSIYVPVRHEGGGNIPRVSDFERGLSAAFEDRSRQGFLTVGHHLGFDLRMALKHGVRLWHPLEDTMINEALIYDLTVGYGLDDLSARWGVTLKKGDELYRLLADRFGGLPDRKTMKNFWRLEGDHPVAVDYATTDGISTLEVRAKQQPKLDEIGVRKPWALECRLLPYLARMHHRGLKIDMGYADRLLADTFDPGTLKSAIAEAAKAFTPGFNFRSPKEVEALYRANGFSEFKLTATGKPSFTEEFLDTNEIGKAILEVRRLEKLRDSFVMPLAVSHNYDGRVHPVLNQSKSDEYGVAGARLSASEPNLQAFPKRNKTIGKKVRPLVIPDEGMVLYEDDFQQQEPRFFTHYSECAALLDGYRSGTMDIHDLSNSLLFHNEDRDKAKRLGMGMLTMLGIPELSRRLKVDEHEAKRLKKAFLDDAFPEIRDFQNAVIKAFRNRGWVKDILGRVAWLEDQRFAYQGVSRVIQNSGGEHMKTGLLRVNEIEDAYPEEINVLLSIHDSTIFQTANPELADAAEKALNGVAHEPDFNLLVPIPVDVGKGKNWSEASYGQV